MVSSSSFSSSSSTSGINPTRRRLHQQQSSKSSSLSTVTGHDGFDGYYEEFSSLIEKLERSLKLQDEETTSELLRKAKEDILPAMAVERRSVSSSERRKHPGLKQHLNQVYEACQMQLQTYQSLSEQPTELFHDLPKDDSSRPISATTHNNTPQNQKHATMSSSYSASSSPSSFEASKEALFAGRNNSNGGGSSSSSSNSLYKNSIRARTQGRVMEQNSQLESAMRSIRESEQIASETIEELQSQRTTLESSSAKMKDLSTMTDQAKKLVKSMNRPWWTKW